jgi:hypothetical protein
MAKGRMTEPPPDKGEATNAAGDHDWVLKRLPHLAERICHATLLHSHEAHGLPPKRSKFGGQILWPAEEPWPISDEFDDVYIPVLQLNAADFPDVVLPSGKDLLQLLWCPHYSSRTGLAPKVYLRRAAEVSNPLAEMPKSRHREEYLPTECRLEPERVQELPSLEELEADELDELDDQERDAYKRSASVATCSKLGGYVAWIQEPDVPSCPHCGAASEHYLTIASAQRGMGEERWRNEETGLSILGGGAMFVFVCRTCEPWTFSFVFQGS